MKISKIDHTRAGITTGKSSNSPVTNTTGVIYDAPPKKADAVRDLDKHIASCNRKAQVLYNMLDTKTDFCNKLDPKKKQYSGLISNFNTVLKAVLTCSRSDVPAERVNAETKKLLSVSSAGVITKNGMISGASLIVQMDNPQEMVSEIILRNMRSSLRKEIRFSGRTMLMTDAAAAILTAVCVNGNSETLDPEMVRAFLEKLDADYSKQEQMELIAKSIEEQHTKVKTEEKDGKVLLKTASADHPKKRYVFDFMTAYAAADNAGKAELEKHMKKLIMLYLCGKDAYTDGEWETLTEQKTMLSGEISSAFEEIAKDREEVRALRAKIAADDAIEDKKLKMPYGDLKVLKKDASKLSSKVRAKEETFVKEILVHAMAQCYRTAVKYLSEEVKVTVLGEVKGIKVGSGPDVFWIDFIDRTVKKLMTDRKVTADSYPYEISYLSKHVWKEWTQFIAMKYTDLGKGVYHFAVPDLSGAIDGAEIVIRDVRPEYASGITGFDYERIKAKESLEREMAEYVAFAANNFARSCADDEERGRNQHEDVLQNKLPSECKDEKAAKDAFHLYPDTDRRILRFFGGKSHFAANEDSLISVTPQDELFTSIRDEIGNVRNMTFHYTASSKEDGIDHSVAGYFFDDEMGEIGRVFKKKYFSNNVHMFYKVSDIESLMGTIYTGRKKRMAQVPAFNRIISRPAIAQHAGPLIKGRPLTKLKNNLDRTVIERYWSSLFFVLKELYYYDFLQEQEDPENDVKARFFRALEEIKAVEKDPKQQKAMADFEARIAEIGRDRSFGEICQGLMVEYMLQNNGDQKVRKLQAQDKKANGRGKDPKELQIYKHYRTLLYMGIRNAFISYLKEKWEVLRTPEFQNQDMKEEDFCRPFALPMYDYLKESFADDHVTASWYITAHFMNPKYLNHLIGSIRNYLQFSGDIEQRAASLGDRVNESLAAENRRYEKILEILEFAINFCGKTTNVLEDYFTETEYMEFLHDFVAFDTSKKVPDLPNAFKTFCASTFLVNGSKQSIGAPYFDGTNIIINRNIILASMYGSSRKLKFAMNRVAEKEIREMYVSRQKLDKVLKEGVCTTKEEQADLRNFQNLKNRVELLDVTIFTELMNDMMAQLVNWSYLRERDLMYFQLGYYYVKLYWTDSIGPDDSRRRLVGNGVNITDGAMLYQILAMNSYSLPVVGNKNGTGFIPGDANIGKAIGLFLKNFDKGAAFYLDGLELFENTDEHDDIVDTRNYIDHFKYFAKDDRSMLDLFSEVYDRFFRYDSNLKKSVSYVLPNILANYFVLTRVNMEMGKKMVGEKKNKKQHNASVIVLPDRLQSAALTYRIKPDKDKTEEVEISARSEMFLKQLKSMLEYKRG